MQSSREFIKLHSTDLEWNKKKINGFRIKVKHQVGIMYGGFDKVNEE